MSDSKFWDKARGRVRTVGSESAEQFRDKARAVAAKATHAYLATAKGDQPKVRIVHPAFEGERIWVATGRTSAKARHIDRNPKVELFCQVGPDRVHLTVTGRAKFIEDVAEKKRIWDARIFDYDLSQFWPDGAESKDFGLMSIEPDRIELTSLADMMAGQPAEVWHR